MSRSGKRLDLVFEDALAAFVEAEGSSLLNGVSERNTCGRLAIYLERQIHADGLVGYYADVEYNRKQEGQVKTIINDRHQVVQITPDLIVHSRGEMSPLFDNLIAVEVKKAHRPADEKRLDLIRLQAMTRRPNDNVWGWGGCHPEHVCGYAVGIFMEIDVVQRRLLLDFVKNGNLTKQKIKPF